MSPLVPVLGTTGLLVAGILLFTLGLYAADHRAVASPPRDRAALYSLGDLIVGGAITLAAAAHLTILLTE